jgi:hypothetical protein
MLIKLNVKKAGQRVATIALLCGLAFSANSIPQVAAQPEPAVLQSVVFTNSTEVETSEAREVRQALANFIRGMAERDAQTVWMYASEEEHMAFQTEAEALAAYVDAFPALTEVQEVSFQSYRNEGDTPFVELAMQDREGNAYRATAGLWLDDAGDWKIVSLDIRPLTDRVAAL